MFICKYFLGFFLIWLTSLQALARQQNVHPQSTTYQWPEDPLVRAKLDKWQDQKFGLILHWGLYAVPGIIESWSICSEDWIERDSTSNYDEYKKWYWGFKDSMNPVKFNPEVWAKAGKDAGMKYLVFTTKHHDGFCMFDTKQTGFKISNGPFANNPKADVAKHIFDAFRKNDFMIGAYFSKPDWHSENYWWPKYATANRNNNYDIRRYPWRWDAFKKYTYNQVSELMNNYGSMDILWLDGGWVRPRETVNEEVLSWGAPIPEWSQDIDMPAIATMSRKAQPGLLIVDRTVHGPYENYQTPEQRVPATQLDHPWESCMTLAGNWGYVPNDQYKSASKIVHTLIEVVAKGGSLLLGVGPKPDGTLPDEAISKMQEIGKWMNKNGEALYSTRTVPDFNQGNLFFVRHKSQPRHFALLCIADTTSMPTTIEWKGHTPANGSTIKILQTGQVARWKKAGDKIQFTLPSSILKAGRTPALAFEFTPASN